MFRFLKNSLLTFVLAVLLVDLPVVSLRTVWAVCPVGDLSGNCKVDLADLMFFAEQWLDTDSLRESVVAHWRLDGNAAETVGGNHGTVYGNPVWTIGQLDGALRFEGDGDYVDCGNDNSLNLSNNFSIAAWFRVDSNAAAEIICKGNTNAFSPGGAYNIFYNGIDGKVYFDVRSSDNTTGDSAGMSVSLDEWTHVTGTFSNGNITIYKDGAFADDGSLPTPTIYINNEPLGIGAEGDGGTAFTGAIDDVRIYDRALNEGEVQEVAYASVLEPNCADMDGDGNVNLYDFTLLANNLHKEGRPLVINEFMAQNGTFIQDPCGGYDDWIEIYNAGSTAVDIGGMYLTDDLKKPSSEWWQIPDNFPAETTIGPYGYLLIWADGDTGQGPLHASFSIKSDEDIGLYDGDKNLIDSISFDEQVTNISEGRYPDGGDTWRFMGFATPDAQNNAGYLGQVADTGFNFDRGFYVDDFNVMITCDTPFTTIRYTTDGSTPTETHGNIYADAITISGTTCLRAAAFRPAYLPSNVDTHTYIFVSDVIAQSLDGAAPGPNWPSPGLFNGQLMDYGMDPKVVVDDSRYSGQTIIDALGAVATVSLVTDLDNLFGASTGIYVNAYSEGRAWERPCSVELIYPPNPRGPGFPDLEPLPDANGEWRWGLPVDMRGGFQIDAGVRIRGGISCTGENPKHAFRLFFRSVYGDAKLRYPLFGDEGEDVFDHMDLRCSQNNSWAFQGNNRNTMVREVFSRDLQGEMGHPYTRSRYYHVYINGHYWGLFQTQERSEASWGESYMGGDNEYYDVVTSDWSAGRKMVPTDGDRAALDRLYDETIAGFNDNERYYRVQGLNTDGTPNDTYEKLLDALNLIDFMIIEYYTGDSDGPGSRFGGIPNNTWGIFNRVNPDGWKWPHHDSENTLGAGGAGGSIENLVEPFTSVGANRDYFNPHWLHEQLMCYNVDYRLQFADHVHHYFHNDGLISLGECRNRILNRAYQIDMAIIAESARWGDAQHPSWAHTKDDHWLPEINRLLYEIYDPWGRETYLTPRVDMVLQQFKDVDWYPDVDEPVFTDMGEYIFMGNPNGSGTLYYTLDGNDPRVPSAQSVPGPLVTLVTEGVAKRYLVPTVANGGNLLGNTAGEFDVTYYKANIIVWSLATAESVISTPSYQSQVIAETSSVINYNNTSCPGRFANDNAVPGGSGDIDDYVIEATGIVQIPSTGNWTFGVHSDAGFSLELTGPGSFYMDYPSTRFPADSFGVFNITTPGAYNLRFVFFERDGWSGVELFAAQGSHSSFNPNFRLVGDIANGGLCVGEPIVWFTNYFDHSSWPSGAGAIGYETQPTSNPNYVGLLNIDVEGQMYDNGGNPNANTSCYIRIPFTCGDAEYNNMTLKVRYDDGFIAYLNGGEVARRVFPEGAMPQWDTNSTGQNPDSAAIDFENIPITSHIGALRQGNNVLAIHGLNISTTDSDFLISVELVAREVSQGDVNPDALTYSSYFQLDKSTHVKARVLDGEMWSPLTGKIYSIGPVRENLRITEIMYHPKYTGDANDPNEEFIELKNIGAETINLNLVRFTKGLDFTFPPMDLEDGHSVIVVKNLAAFGARYPGFSGLIAGEYVGSLANNGERLKLVDAIGQTILDFEYEDGWRPITDGDGFSLTIIDPTNSEPNNWSEKESWRASVYRNGSPGADDSGILPNPGAVVINEVMSHSNAGPDWIELHNTTSTPINIGGWFLSDNDRDEPNLVKYRIGDGTTIPFNGYIVFYEDTDFNNPGDPGCLIPFALSENGEEACLSSPLDPNGMLTGYREVEDFGASQTNVSFGRYYKSSTDNFNFVAMDSNTPGWSNGDSIVGPVVINEIMYNPPTGNQNEEYVELHNITGSPVTLFRTDKLAPWKFTDGIDYTFRGSSPYVTIPANGYLMVVKDLASFIIRYGTMPGGVRVLDDYDGMLSNGGERLQIGMPGDTDEFGTRYYIRIDRVTYSDGWHPEDCPGGIDYWPPEADGLGKSLSRKDPNDYGNDVANWEAATPSPGVANP
ncbi:MAG: lamin tail domain-containing protein [Planctomycetota bacterium]